MRFDFQTPLSAKSLQPSEGPLAITVSAARGLRQLGKTLASATVKLPTS